MEVCNTQAIEKCRILVTSNSTNVNVRYNTQEV